MFFNSHKIDINKDTLYSALMKKSENKSLSKKTLRKLSKLANSQNKLSLEDAKKLFIKNDRIQLTEKNEGILQVLHQARANFVTHYMESKVNTWIYNCTQVKKPASFQPEAKLQQQQSTNLAEEDINIGHKVEKVFSQNHSVAPFNTGPEMKICEELVTRHNGIIREIYNYDSNEKDRLLNDNVKFEKPHLIAPKGFYHSGHYILSKRMGQLLLPTEIYVKDHKYLFSDARTGKFEFRTNESLNNFMQDYDEEFYPGSRYNVYAQWYNN